VHHMDRQLGISVNILIVGGCLGEYPESTY
jgi:hypothetical protein